MHVSAKSLFEDVVAFIALGIMLVHGRARVAGVGVLGITQPHDVADVTGSGTAMSGLAAAGLRAHRIQFPGTICGLTAQRLGCVADSRCAFLMPVKDRKPCAVQT